LGKGPRSNFTMVSRIELLYIRNNKKCPRKDDISDDKPPLGLLSSFRRRCAALCYVYVIFERLSPPRGLAKVPIGRDLLALCSCASGLDALLSTVFYLLAVTRNRLCLNAAIEIGMRRGEVSFGRAALHRRRVCITCVGNHSNKCSVGYIHGECM